MKSGSRILEIEPKSKSVIGDLKGEMEIQFHTILTKLNYLTIVLHQCLHLKMTMKFQSVIIIYWMKTMFR